MNGFTNELLVKKAKRNWRTRCGAFLLAALASWCGGAIQDAYGQAVLSTGDRWGDNVAIDDQQTANRVGPNFGPNIGNGYDYTINRDGNYSVEWEIARNHQQGLDLFDVASGNVQAYVLYSPQQGDPVRVQNKIFGAYDDFAANGTTWTVSQSMIWTGDIDASGVFNTQGNELRVTGRFNTTDNLTINAYNGSNSTGGYLTIAGNGSNANNMITIGTGGLRLTGNFSNANGTIDISQNGILALGPSYTLSGNVSGNGMNTAGTRGMIALEGNATFNGNWSGNVTVSGVGEGGFASGFGENRLNARNASASGLSVLRVTDGADILLESAGNVGSAQLVFADYGSFTQHQDTAVLTLDNNIRFDNNGNVGQGAFNVLGVIGAQQYDADYIVDVNKRLVLTGDISSDLTFNQTFHVNEALGAAGAVSIQGNSDYHGDYHIHAGALEVASGESLGPFGNPTLGTDYQLIIGGSSVMGPAAFRVVNAGTTQNLVIGRAVRLDSAYSTYEVFTGDIAASNANLSNRHTMADADRLTVIQTGSISGLGSLNKAGDGRLVLAAAANSYQGDTVITHGILSISSSSQINDKDKTKSIIIGTADHDVGGYRPVFETTTNADSSKYNEAKTISINNARVQINQQNSVIRTTGALNNTIINTEITSVVPNAVTAAPVLNKEGAGTLTMNGQGNWGYERTGETNIRQGTVQISNKNNIAKGDITIGADLTTLKDLEGIAADYEAVLKLADNAGYQDLPNNIILGSAEDSYIEVGTGSNLGIHQVGQLATTQNNLNKRGEGILTLNGIATFTGWTNIEEGTLLLTVKDQLLSSAGVDLVGPGTLLDMSSAGADQTLNGLRGVDADYADSPADWTRKVNIGANTLTLNQQEDAAVLNGAILGTGRFVKGGIDGSEFATGFEIGDEKFAGTIDVQAGTLRTLTDATFTGFTGRAGSYFDVNDKEVTVDIADNQAYLGTVISSYPVRPYTQTAVRPHLIKDGAGTWTANFSQTNIGSGVRTGYEGDLTILEGKIVSTSDYYMEGGGTLTFGVDADMNASDVATLDVSKHSAIFRLGGESGNEITEVHVDFGDMSTGWNAKSGPTTIGKILGDDKSDYSGLVASNTDSLFYQLELEDVRGTGRYDKHVNMNVVGFEGIGDSFNTKAVGRNLDNVRVSDLSGNHIGALIADLWAAGMNMENEAMRQERVDMLLDVYQQLSADTIANATFMGLDKPWQAAFGRLNLDSQMVYLNPNQPGQPRAIANMRNLWFTPTVQSLTARSDGNARRFGIDRPGYKIGWDKRVFQNASVGFQLGFSSPKLRQGDDRVEGSDFQFGVYGGAMVGNYVEMKGFIGFGHQSFKSNRNIYLPGAAIIPDGNGGFRPIGGANRTMVSHGRFDGDTFNFSFEVSRPLFLGFTILRPTIGLDSEHAYRYAFTETGDVTSMKFSRASLSRTRARFGLSLETTTLDRAIFTGRLGYSCLLGGTDYAETSGQFVGVYAANQAIRSVAVGKSYFEAGVGTRIFLNPVKTLALVGNYDATVGNRWAEHQAVVGFTYVY